MAASAFDLGAAEGWIKYGRFDLVLREALIPASVGDARAQFVLGLLHEARNFEGCNMAKAIEWYGKAAEQDYMRANYKLGDIFLRGAGVSKDPARGFSHMLRAAEAGDNNGQATVAWAYFLGRGVDRNIPLALHWAEEGARRHPNAVALLAHMNFYGVGTPKDVAKAVDLIANTPFFLWNPGADLLKGKMLLDGIGFARDEAQGVKLIREAAESSYPPAMRELAVLYDDGIVLARDSEKAELWREKADDRELQIMELEKKFAAGTKGPCVVP